jgi:hypothetical protein
LTESYATGLEWFITNQVYGPELPVNRLARLDRQALAVSDPVISGSCEGYSALFIDLLDDENQINLQRRINAILDCDTISLILNAWTRSVDGHACRFLDAPTGSTPFVLNGRAYYTPQTNGVPCPLGSAIFDGQNCDCGSIPSGRHAFISNQSIYVLSIGFSNVPHDVVSGYQPWQWQNAMHNAKSILDLKNNLRNLYWNAGEGLRLDTLFEAYTHINFKSNTSCVSSKIF